MDAVITITGNLVADPTIKTVANGQTVAEFRLASNSRRFDREAGEFRDGNPLYITVSCWRTLGGNVHASLRRGDSVVVSGRLIFREFDDKGGVHRSVHSIDAISVGPDLARWAVDVRRPAKPTDSDATASVPPVAADGAPAEPDPVAA